MTLRPSSSLPIALAAALVFAGLAVPRGQGGEDSRGAAREARQTPLSASAESKAQSPGEPETEGLTPPSTGKDTSNVLWGRGREVLHTGEPLRIRGLEEGDNDFRERTPALERSDRKVAFVDLSELRDRKLAMYDGAASFHAPLNRTAPPEGFEHRVAEHNPTQASSPQGAESTGDSGLSFALGLFLGALIAGYLTVRALHRVAAS